MPAIVSVRNLLDYPVVDPRGESLGKIDDVVLAPDLTNVISFVLKVGGTLGVGSERLGVPASGVRLDTEAEALVVEAEPRRLDAIGART